MGSEFKFFFAYHNYFVYALHISCAEHFYRISPSMNPILFNSVPVTNCIHMNGALQTIHASTKAIMPSSIDLMAVSSSPLCPNSFDSCLFLRRLTDQFLSFFNLPRSAAEIRSPCLWILDTWWRLFVLHYTVQVHVQNTVHVLALKYGGPSS